MELQVPPSSRTDLWPTLGPQVCQAIEQNLVFGPGDLRGEPARLDDEQRLFIYRFYEIHPKGSPREGKRRFQRCAISLRKGTRKTELLAWIAAVELHPEAPVRCDGFRKVGGIWEPVGRPVTDPYIPLVAYTEEQSDELAYGALLAMLGHDNCAWVNDFDLGLTRIMRLDGAGKVVSLATAPDSRDGARTTFEGFDETHRLTLPRQRETHKVMLANLLKRPIADPWALETSTMYKPGEGSVAEGTHDYARKVKAGEVRDTRLYYYHRQASDKHNLDTREGLTAAVVESSGITAEWSDVEGIVAQWDDPDADKSYLIQTWLNMPVRATARAFDLEVWKTLVKRIDVVERNPRKRARGAEIVAGFDGSRTDDSTALVATEIANGHQWPLGIWYPEDGRIPREKVIVAIDDMFERYEVRYLYADPPKWETQLSELMAKYGDDRIVEAWTYKDRQMAEWVRSYTSAIVHREVSHSGDERLTEHIGNACRRYVNARDEDGHQLCVITKERPDSPHKIDGAVAAVLSWAARMQALAAGHQRRKGGLGMRF